MFVCSHCLQAIESHEGNQTSRKISYLDDVDIVCGEFDEDGNFVEDEYGSEECIKCEWCGEYMPVFDMYEI